MGNELKINVQYNIEADKIVVGVIENKRPEFIRFLELLKTNLAY